MVNATEPRRTAETVQVPSHDLQLLYSEVQMLELIPGSSIEKGFEAQKQPVMCDFEIVKDETDPARFFVALLVEMENSRNAPNVLSFALSTVTGFAFHPNGTAAPLPDDEQARWHLFHTAVSASISAARGYLTNYMAPTIYRGYQLPLLNVDSLIDRKYERPLLPQVPSAAPGEQPPKPGEKKARE